MKNFFILILTDPFNLHDVESIILKINTRNKSKYKTYYLENFRVFVIVLEIIKIL